MTAICSLDALSAIVEILAERLELDRIPPDSHTKTGRRGQGEHVHCRRLFRHQRGLPLRKDEDSRDQLDALGDGGRKPNSTKGSWNTWRYVYGPFQPPGRSGFAPRT
jgi:hypothetical protein